MLFQTHPSLLMNSPGGKSSTSPHSCTRIPEFSAQMALRTRLAFAQEPLPPPRSLGTKAERERSSPHLTAVWGSGRSLHGPAGVEERAGRDAGTHAHQSLRKSARTCMGGGGGLVCGSCLCACQSPPASLLFFLSVEMLLRTSSQLLMISKYSGHFYKPL